MNALEPEWLKKPKAYKQCPKCKQFELDTRLPRGFIAKHVLFWKPLKKYRCGNCNAEVYVQDK